MVQKAVDPTESGSGGDEILELFRLAGVSHIAQLPLAIEQDIQRYLRQAGEAIVPSLAAGLEDRDPKTRMKVATYLGQIRSESCVAPLVSALDDEDQRVRLLAVISLRDCGDLRSAALLLSRLDDSDDRVRGAAADALARLTNHAHCYNPYAPPEERAASTQALREWLRARDGQSQDAVLAEGFRAQGHDVADLTVASGPGLVAALADTLSFVHGNAQRILEQLTGERRTLEDELQQLDPEAAGDYADVRATALARLQAFYLDRLAPAAS